MDNTAVTTQQPSPAGGQTPPKQLHSSGPVSMRNATESAEDREFLGRVVIDGFEGKYIHATNRERYIIRISFDMLLENAHFKVIQKKINLDNLK